jgi:S-DNA-T family DNA segregation ATPase FtsK/SpoIIIE
VERDGYDIGPTFARLRVQPVGKTNFKAVSNKAVDLKMSLGLDIVPIVGSQAGCISIDIQRPNRATVPLTDALANAPKVLSGKPAFPVGQDVTGQSHWLNLADPSDCHMLVAGTTGSGKSEFLRAILGSLAARLGPEQVQFVLIDPKRVTFNLHGSSPYLRHPIAHDVDEALPIIEKCMAEMDRRYKLLEKSKLSDVSELSSDMMPRIVMVIDEFAGFLDDKESKKAVTALLKRLGAMARAAGIHLILATQRPDKDVITPLLRENLPGRIALRVASKAGSDLILGASDAENLLGKGDLLWKRGGELLRLQSPYIGQADLERTLRCEA